MFQLVSPVVPWVAEGMESPGRLPAADAGAQGCRRQLGKEKPAPCRGFSCCGVGLFWHAEGALQLPWDLQGQGNKRSRPAHGPITAEKVS